MQTMTDAWAWMASNVAPHWPWVAGYFGFYFVGAFMKAQVWTKRRARTSKPFHFMRRTMAMHPVLVGALVGALPSMPVSPGIEYPLGAMLYWCSAGMASSFTFHAFSDYLKKKTGVDLEGAVGRAVNPGKPEILK